MQTFLPYPDFTESARCLDYRRLGKQRVEGKQILSACVLGPAAPWGKHPAVLMWRGYEEALKQYTNTMIAEWIRRGYSNSMPFFPIIPSALAMPPWLGKPEFHMSHRSNLLRKDPKFYSRYGWTEPPDIPYDWPEGKLTSSIASSTSRWKVSVKGNPPIYL
jgi:hypothetical protein